MSVKKTTIGGQALIEGILMRGPENSCIVVRRPDGTFAVKDQPANPILKNKFLRLPFIRGIVGFVDSLACGISAINYSAEQSELAEGEQKADLQPGKFEAWLNSKFGQKATDTFVLVCAMIFACIIPVLLFIMLPTVIAGLFGDILGSGITRNLTEGALRIAIFILYLAAVSQVKDIKRTFMYHGAEHKTIFCYEAGLPLTVENVRKQSRFHPRCGTSFLFVIMIISILVFSVFSWSNVWLRMALRLLMLPVVVGISYEISRILGRYDNFITIALRSPGLALQRLTTSEPDDSMIEVAINALTAVIPEDESADKW